MAQNRDELRAALQDLADFERRVVLMEPDRHRAYEIAVLFEEAAWLAEAAASYRLAGEVARLVRLEARLESAPPRQPAPAPLSISVASEGPFTLLEELAMALQSRGNAGVAEHFSTLFARSLAGEGLPPESVVQAAAKLEAAHGPVAALRVEIAAALLCLGEDVAAYQVLAREVARPDATLRAKKLFAGVLEARGRVAEALAVYESIAARRIDYPGVKAAMSRLGDEITIEGRYIEEETLLRRQCGGVVVRARDRHLGREVVIKRQADGRTCSSGRVDRELDVRERAAHPALVMILDIDPKSQSVIYESLSGDLAAHGAASGPAQQPVHWASICEAVARMHAVGLVHGRIAPEHVLFSERRGLVLGGLAEASEDLVKAPEDVRALACCIEDALCGRLSHAQRAVLAASQSSDPASRPAARALAKTLIRA